MQTQGVNQNDFMTDWQAMAGWHDTATPSLDFETYDSLSGLERML